MAKNTAEDSVEAMWNAMQDKAPAVPKGKPSPEQLGSLRAHKARTKAFLATLSQEQRSALFEKNKNDKPSKAKGDIQKSSAKMDKKEILGGQTTVFGHPRMLTRDQRADIAQETVEILQRGWYNPSKAPGRRCSRQIRVNIAERLENARSGTEVHLDPANEGPMRFDHARDGTFLEGVGLASTPLGFAQAVLQLQSAKATAEESETILAYSGTTAADFLYSHGEILPMRIDIVQETTLSGAQALAQQGKNTCFLNFASGKNPGGGFLRGSEAQEESLARSTGLYFCIGPNNPTAIEMYRQNRQNNNFGLYSHGMIYSPRVPIFRDDEGRLLPEEEVVESGVLTCPAPNAGVAAPRLGVSVVEEEMYERICRIVSAMERHGHNAIVLGSFGCGVFRNCVEHVAQCFAIALAGRKFDVVRFSLISEKDVAVFANIFGQRSCLNRGTE
uniref:Microbial-type PARG catalytic domain-containing protein n=1 Tax=Trieres chinensis TaxID=1514140 RepID=A0A7S1ZHR6_TRICV|mmetsp:Transcript_25989/g.53174  ORF Transcript_25989/g.53174 Transcript_25989/m.53174 type:complete len:445 (+) Transcript_25989:38-1372(+)